MKFSQLLESKGFSLTEIMIAMGIMAVVALGGISAYQYFEKNTKKEIGKMNDLVEFNLLTKDLLKFTEGAGVSVAYLNLPVKVKDCNENEPCIRQLKDNKFIAPEAGTLPSQLNNETCLQFYHDGKGQIDKKLAYPTSSLEVWQKDMVAEVKIVGLTPNPMIELATTWTLKDKDSPPLLMMKMKEGGISLKLLNEPQISRDQLEKSNISHSYALFQGEPGKKDMIKSLKGYPFLLYNVRYTNHFTIQYADNILACEENVQACKSIFNSISTSIPALSGSSANIYAIEFKEIEYDPENDPFFSPIFKKRELPADCLSSWSDKESTSKYLFPTKGYSVSGRSTSPLNDLKGPSTFRVLTMNHYYRPNYEIFPQGSTIPVMIAVPIDLVTYKVVEYESGKRKKLVSNLWHRLEIKERTKIQDLRAPFTVSRKLGSGEMGIWYNPLKKSETLATTQEGSP